MTKAKELRDQTDQQLQILIEDSQKDIFEMRNQIAVNRKIDHSHLIREKRKDIARAKTLIAERKRKVEKE